MKITQKKSSINLVSRAELANIMNEQDIVMSFKGANYMNMLHTVNKSPFENSSVSSCLSLCARKQQYIVY